MLDWAREILDQMQGICELLDAGDPKRTYSTALAVQAAKLDDVTRTPSARLIAELRSTGESFFDLALRTSAAHKAYFLDLHPPDDARSAVFAEEARGSLERADALARAPRGDFDAYLASYLA
jgi:glutamate--cysteine ligase